ncbi:uncharacterized protein HMPREF1541_09390 [Cyphellophora europaea CBS 101466]|uniref:Zn(2)-C6 fungal-type domain-containing protein n=1 Tax=Cyphellophora europaea (strain CBS 101466) TaxID=1220924 RepID=W2SC14_CYPE1|nr:uncharacterized protein HMPREF1541_09390 [Cyphellophora europaea CBS 101466]ETN45558.1 hypothetical protein HMPREF1541_09390 [Cyphellophora europaea CBS 101466]
MDVSSRSRQPGSPPTKRRKAQLVCNSCRERKTRCDGVQPVCSPCQSRGQSDFCQYQQSALKTQRYVTELERRVKELEKGNAVLLAARETRDKGQRSSGLTPQLPLARTNELGTSPSQTRPPFLDHREEYAAKAGLTVDGLATVSPVPLQAIESVSFGNSSTIAFLRNLLSMVDGTTSLQHPPNNLAESFAPVSEAEDLDLTTLTLPNRQLADSVVDSFFAIVHPLYPVLHQPTFTTHYHALWTPTASLQKGTRIRQTPLLWATANLVFALGSQFSELVEPSERARISSQFYRRAHDLLAGHLADTCSMEGVQVLLLISIYLQSTHHASRCWNILGLAIRSAQGLGLHLEQRHQSCPTQLQSEIGRRVWHNCVILDKLQSMTFGRPSMLTKSAVKPPVAVDDEYLACGVQPTGQSSRLSFFVLSIDLFDILSDILATVYSSEDGKSSSEGSTNNLHEVIRLSAALDKFASSIPRHLQFHAPHQHESAEEHIDKVFKLQSNVLHCRYLYARLILLRPSLLSACADAQSSNHLHGAQGVAGSLESQLNARASSVCADAARSLVAAIHANMHSVFRNSVWYTVYFTFSAATVLVASKIYNIRRLQDFSESTWESSDYQETWGKIIDILRYHEDRISSAGRAKQVLEALGSKVEAMGERSHLTTSAAENNSFRADPERRDWTAEDFSILNLSNAWFMQEITNLDFLNIGTDI